jgi:predicted metalloprotease
MATVMKGQSAHFRATPGELDKALTGFLQFRDPAPVLFNAAFSHGNGFDRLSAFADGLNHGPTFCYNRNWFQRPFTERPFVTAQDYQSGGNETLAQVLNPNPTAQDQTAGGLQPDLNRFWTSASQAINKTWTPVKTAKADKLPCSSSLFGYCPTDNTTYYNKDFASKAYFSIPDKQVDRATADVTLIDKQAGDFALGTLFAVAWGMAVRHQLFNEDITGKDALLGAACYTGAYAKDINRQTNDDGKHPFLLSPPDMDEATFAMLDVVGQEDAFGSRGTTGLERVQEFVKGYEGGLSVC